MLADAGLAENHRSASLPLDEQGYESHDWRDKKKGEGCQYDVKNALQ